MIFYHQRRVWIAGASQGIGRSLARQLASYGAELTLFARNLEPLDRLRAELSSPSRCQIHTLDITNKAQVESVVSQAIKDHDVPDIVMVLAGFARAQELAESDLEDHEGMLRSNYLGTLYFTRAILPHLLARGSGSIIHTSSLAGLLGLPYYTGYCASKFAVMGFSEALRRELWGSGVTVTLLMPPNVRTPGLATENLTKPASLKKLEETVSCLEPEDVATHLLKKLPSSPPIVIPCWSGWALYYASRLAPGLIDWWGRRA